MSDSIEYLYKIIGKHPTGNKMQVVIEVDKLMNVIHEINNLNKNVYAYPPEEPYVPDGLTWKQLYAYKEQEKRGGQPVDSYLKTMKATSDLLMAHHRQAIEAMAHVMQDKDMSYIEDVWKEAMSAFMTMPKKIMEGNK